MEKSNIFDLTTLVGTHADQEIKHNIISADEQKKLLMNYTEVPRDKWTTMPLNSHIRYSRKDGNFRKGGFIKNIWASVGDEKTCIQLASNLGYKATQWNIYLDDINIIWKKIDHSEEKPIIIDTKQKDDMEYLLRSVDQLKIDVTKLANEQSRIINVLKKIVNNRKPVR